MTASTLAHRQFRRQKSRDTVHMYRVASFAESTHLRVAKNNNNVRLKRKTSRNTLILTGNRTPVLKTKELQTRSGTGIQGNPPCTGKKTQVSNPLLFRDVQTPKTTTEKPFSIQALAYSTISLSLSQSHTHTHTHTLSLSLSLTHTHTHTSSFPTPPEQWQRTQRSGKKHCEVIQHNITQHALTIKR